METRRHIFLVSIIIVSLVPHTAFTLKCYNCHYAYHASKEVDKEFTDTYYNERDPSESLLHKDCGDDKPPDGLLITCPDETNAVCWMGVFVSETIKGVARGCDVQSDKDLQMSKQKLNSCWPTVKDKSLENSQSDKTNCYCNSGDGCSDWTFPGKKDGESVKRMLGGGESGSDSTRTTIASSGVRSLWFLTMTSTIIISFLFY